MFHRQKMLLALLGAFGGKLRSTDCQKLMFLHCQYHSRDYYDFFPYKYGAFSFTLQYDKQKLTERGYLEHGEDFRLAKARPRVPQIDPALEMELAHLKSEVGSLRGNNLLRKVYLEYPYYATRSVVVGEVLDRVEAETIEMAKPTESAPGLFTLGYEGLSIDRYLDVLISHSIIALVDVRKNPVSRKFGFSKNRLEKAVENVSISYIHIPELGVPSDMRHALSSREDYTRLFTTYSTKILPANQDALELLHSIVKSKTRVALTCFEEEPTCCHRSQITKYFAEDSTFDIPITHL